MSETHQYVNRSNLATFLAKIKELIPSSLTFLTKTEAEETYQEKLEGYTERINEHTGALDITIDAKDGDGGNGLLTVGAGDLLINTRATTTGSGVVVNLNGGGQFKLNNGQGFIYNNSYVLTRSDVVDGLTSELEDRPLSANQGRVLNEKISDILPKSDVMTNTDVAMLSRVFALPLSSYVGAGLYQPSTDTIGKYTEMFNSLADGELVVCEYQGVKGLYVYRGSSHLYCFTQYIADLNNLPIGVEDSLTSSSSTIALSANQGKVLNEGKQDKLECYYEDNDGAHIDTKAVEVIGDGDVSIKSQIGNISITADKDVAIKGGSSTATIGSDGITLNSGSTITLDNGDYSLAIGDKVYANHSPVLTESTGIKSTDIRNVQYVDALPGNPSSDTLYLIPE